ncbi:MAG: UDP-N-acetylglucosamine 2-epimerase (non-hydrolyzing) [Acidobacteria bacterium]|nr:UDP-N-acetylglucosamine 2-epimerase (non-hydrolyzing) [Acidobacteriota bacterium]MBI3422425.1 UDP-N-acetylglucosamine 2-epimerase (non-hydrolyzing) [Acidobacteriota bacterium]
MMKFLNIVGARPNFMKMAPLLAAIQRRAGAVTQTLVHTGQHYDEAMSASFFRDLGMPAPDINLEIGSGTHAEQTARVMLAFEPVLLEQKPDWVIVVGDVNSTLACALVARKLGIKVAHVEAGLRSFDRDMPEEINRILTDQLSDLLLTPSPDGDANLLREGIAPERIVRVGNVMIDTLLEQVARAQASPILRELELAPHTYGVVTLHRPSNVDEPESLRGILAALGEIARELPLVFPAHPRTQARMREFGLAVPAGIRVIDPLGYLEFLRLWSNAKLVLTDSGGLQEETTALGVPCLTLRESTERPITIEQGTNRLVGCDAEKIKQTAFAVLRGELKLAGRVPELWDGKTAARIVDALLARS